MSTTTRLLGGRVWHDMIDMDSHFDIATRVRYVAHYVEKAMTRGLFAGRSGIDRVFVVCLLVQRDLKSSHVIVMVEWVVVKVKESLPTLYNKAVNTPSNAGHE